MLNTDAAAPSSRSSAPTRFHSRARLGRETQLAVPDSAYAQILVYRKDLFEKAGLNPPTTYEALRTPPKP